MNHSMSKPSHPTDSAMPGVGFGLMAALIWGAWPVISGLGVGQSLSALDITALRFAIAGLILLPLVLHRRTDVLSWPRSLMLSIGAGAPYVLIMTGGLTYAPAGHAGVITPSCMLIFSTLGSRWLLGDEISPNRWIGIGVIVTGVVCIGWSGFSTREGNVWIGDIMFVVGGGLWASYTLLSKLWRVDALHATALVSVVSMVLYLPVYLLTSKSNLMQTPLDELLLQGVFQGVFASIIALLCYTRSVGLLGAARGAVFAALVPGIAVLLAYPVLGEVLGAQEIVGVGAVTIGMGIALGRLSVVSPNK